MVVKSALVAAFLSAFLFAACSPKAGESVVLEVGPSKVTLEEFEDFYARNSGTGDTLSLTPIAERERFLDLLTRYKLKLQDAADRNLAADPEVQTELRDYRASLATTYIIEKEITEPGIRLLYDRKTEEIRGKHILVAVKPEASPAETLKAYTKVMDLIGRLKAGADFDSLAMADSEDPTVKSNRGDLYFFTGGQMVMPFENGAYAMKVNETPNAPIRTSFGYHILKITARQPVRGSIKVRHLMALVKQAPADTGDTAAALGRIRAWQDSLAKGIDFAELAKSVSEDAGSAVRGGDLGWFERKRYVQQFDEAAFLLKPGEVSPVVKTPYGYHLLKCDSLRPIASYAEMRAQQGDPLKRQYQQVRFTDDFNDYVARLMKEFDYSFQEGTISSLLSVLDSNTTTQDSGWDATITESIRLAPLIRANGVVYGVDTVLTMLLKRPELQNTLLRRSDLERQFRKISEAILLEAKSAGLEQRSPAFGSLMKDYRDGIVLYRAEQLEVWNRVTVTDSALRAYWDQHKADFAFPAKVTFAEMNFDSDTLALTIYDSLIRGADFDALARVHNYDDSLKAKGGLNDPQPGNLDDVAKMLAGMDIGQVSEPVSVGSGITMIVKLIAKEP
ncbi:MAG TPA: peptidylprolyl isomerase, partial [Bacteroidota bacterium]|nr:peptidylprolyl isomerase [Bacteroidota bacterium]